MRPSNTGLTRIERHRLLDHLRVIFQAVWEHAHVFTCQLLLSPETICWCRKRALSICSCWGKSRVCILDRWLTENWSGPTPYELLCTSLAACTVMTMPATLQPVGQIAHGDVEHRREDHAEAGHAQHAE